MESKIVKFIEAETRMVGPRGWRERNGVLMTCWKILSNKAPQHRKLGICNVSPFLSSLPLQCSFQFFLVVVMMVDQEKKLYSSL